MIHLHHHKYGYVKYIYILYVTKVIYGNIIILTCTFEICIYDNMIVKIRVLLHFGQNSQLVKFNNLFHPFRAIRTSSSTPNSPNGPSGPKFGLRTVATAVGR